MDEIARTALGAMLSAAATAHSVKCRPIMLKSDAVTKAEKLLKGYNVLLCSNDDSEVRGMTVYSLRHSPSRN